ncbi:MAG: acyltransferase [Chloroflexi bacterium]|nr:acyltransferase [Chloroflexota bacterium]MBV9544968.1 acyltransferase [Chloroflexota bacterium]
MESTPSSSARFASPDVGQRRTFGLPRAPSEYLASPGPTLDKFRSALNARWQLRNCNHVGRWTRLSGRAIVLNRGGYISIGERVLLFFDYIPSIFAVFQGGRLEIGDRTSINYGADFAVTGLVKIGEDCGIGTHVIVMDNDFHEIGDRSRRPEPKPVVIGNRVWLANRSTILPGVTIGDDAIIGAGSVVMTDIPERSLAMGNPARVIKKL